MKIYKSIIRSPFLLIVAFLFCSFSFSSCEETGTTTGTTTTTEDDNPPAIPINKKVTDKELEKMGNPRDVKSFNAKASVAAKNKEAWVSSPELTLLKFAGETMNEMHTRTIKLESINGSEDVSIIFATIEEDGYMDDSIRGSKMFIRMIKEGGFYKVNSASEVWRCRQNRGHLEYSTEECK